MEIGSVKIEYHSQEHNAETWSGFELGSTFVGWGRKLGYIILNSCVSSAVMEVARRLVWRCLVDDPVLFFRIILEQVTKRDKQVRWTACFVVFLSMSTYFILVNFWCVFVSLHSYSMRFSSSTKFLLNRVLLNSSGNTGKPVTLI